MERIYKLLPKYAFFPILVSLFINFITYFGTRLITTDMAHYNLSMTMDDRLPLVTPMILIYLLAYVSWIVGFIVIGRESRAVCYDTMSAEQIAKIICLCFFILLPTCTIRPEITGTGVFDRLTDFVYSVDSADNLFPSVHCLESWICFRGIMNCKKVGRRFKWVMFLSAILVFASTVLVKQHVIVDILGAIFAVETGLFFAKRLQVGNVYYKLEHKLEKYER